MKDIGFEANHLYLEFNAAIAARYTPTEFYELSVQWQAAIIGWYENKMQAEAVINQWQERKAKSAQRPMTGPRRR